MLGIRFPRDWEAGQTVPGDGRSPDLGACWGHLDNGSRKSRWEARVGQSHPTAVPGSVVEVCPLVEMHEADGEEGQQPWHGHVAPQESPEGPQRAAQLSEHFFPEPGLGAVGRDVWEGALLWPPGPGALGRVGPPVPWFSHRFSTLRDCQVLPGTP